MSAESSGTDDWPAPKPDERLPDQQRSRRGVVLVVSVVAALAATGAGLAVALAGDDSEPPTTTSAGGSATTMPVDTALQAALDSTGVADPEVTAAYLIAVDGLLANPDGGCGLAEVLEAGPDPNAIAVAAAGSSDAIVEDLLADHQLAVYSTIAACRGDAPVNGDEAIAELIEAHELLLEYVEEVR